VSSCRPSLPLRQDARRLGGRPSLYCPQNQVMSKSPQVTRCARRSRSQQLGPNCSRSKLPHRLTMHKKWSAWKKSCFCLKTDCADIRTAGRTVQPAPAEKRYVLVRNCSRLSRMMQEVTSLSGRSSLFLATRSVEPPSRPAQPAAGQKACRCSRQAHGIFRVSNPAPFRKEKSKFRPF